MPLDHTQVTTIVTFLAAVAGGAWKMMRRHQAKRPPTDEQALKAVREALLLLGSASKEYRDRLESIEEALGKLQAEAEAGHRKHDEIDDKIRHLTRRFKIGRAHV